MERVVEFFIFSVGVRHTGDPGYYDETGLHFSGRSKLVIQAGDITVFFNLLIKLLTISAPFSILSR